jgi:hypothetical protein
MANDFLLQRPKPAKKPKRKRALRILVPLLLVLLVIGGYVGYRAFQSATAEVITDSKAHTYEAYPTEGNTKHFDEKLFEFDAPDDWKFIGLDNSTYAYYKYQSTKKNFEARNLDIYVDKIPADMALNRVVAVKAQGARLSHGDASENCTSFATPDPSQAGTAAALKIKARWDGIEFLCDNDTKFRNILGTTSTDGINTVKLTGPTAGAHSFFFVYTDHSSISDKTIFYRVLESFKVK